MTWIGHRTKEQGRMNVYIMTASAALIALLAGAAAGLAKGPSGYANVATPAADLAAKTCAACHGPFGNSTDPRFPKLAGQSPRYLAARLWAFKAEAPPLNVMANIAASLSASEIAGLAQFYADQPVRPDPVKDNRLAERGRWLFFNGAGWPAPTPPCAQCHDSRGRFGPPTMGGMMGPGMMGGAASAPNLYGQHARYIVGQLQQFARGQRPSWMMGRIAADLTPQDRKAVAEYLSGRR